MLGVQTKSIAPFLDFGEQWNVLVAHKSRIDVPKYVFCVI